MYLEKIKGEVSCSVVIPVFNTKEILFKNLTSVLEAFKQKSNKIIEIIVVDDASTDGTYEYVKKEFPEIRLVIHTKNRGFSSSVNTGAMSSKGKLLVLINSDVMVTKNFLVKALECFNDDRVFAVSLHEEGYAWAKGYFENGYVQYGQGSEGTGVHESFWVSAGSGVYRRDYWMKLGGLDEKLLSPFYKEDLDLSYRAAKRGLLNLWNPNSLVFHKHKASVNKLNKKYVARIIERNELLFHWKNITSPNLFRKHILGMLTRLASHPGYIVIILMALRRYSEVMKARRREVLESKVSDEAIFARFKNV